MTDNLANRRKTLATALALASFATLPFASAAPATSVHPPPAAVSIAPYEITYHLSLIRAEERAGMVTASGELFSRLQGGPCEGWTSDSRMKIRFVFRREGTRETESRVASWESDDGNRFYSRIERRLNGTVVERVQVSVRRERAGEPFHLHMRAPGKLDTVIPPQTLFPTAALKKLLVAAEKGRHRLSFLLYEGDEEASPQHVVALIGRRHAALEAASDEAPPPEREAVDKAGAPTGGGEGLAWLARTPYWPVSLAYYGPLKRADGSQPSEKEREAARFGLPEYEVHFRLYANGVTGGAHLIYPDYVLRARPVSLKFLPHSSCR